MGAFPRRQPATVIKMSMTECMCSLVFERQLLSGGQRASSRVDEHESWRANFQINEIRLSVNVRVTFVGVDFRKVEIYDVLALSYHAGYITLLRSWLTPLEKDFRCFYAQP